MYQRVVVKNEHEWCRGEQLTQYYFSLSHLMTIVKKMKCIRSLRDIDEVVIPSKRDVWGRSNNL